VQRESRWFLACLRQYQLAITVPSNVLLARQDGYWNSDRARQLVLMFACRDAYVALP
jgi:hypothetical protein